MKRSHFILGTYLFFTTGICVGQINYPFMDMEENRDIQAYWYNVPQAVVEMEVGGTLDFQSVIHVYGKMPGDLFQVEVEVYSKSGKKVFEKEFDINKAVKSNGVQFRDGFFKVIQPVEYLEENPPKILVTIKSDGGKRRKEIQCCYHRISGRMTDFEGNPIEGHIVVCPDAFAGSRLGVLTDKEGNYEVVLPERTYNAIVGNTEQYGVSRAEAWGWHTIVDKDQQLDFKIGNGEVYNLNVWANNGGGQTYFVSFRPMVLAQAMKGERIPVQMNGRDFQIGIYTPELEVGNIQVTINGKTAEILSLQKYYETGSPNAGCIAYIIQIQRSEEHGITGKQTVAVSYEKTFEMDGKTIEGNSMGCFQFYLNFNGLSNYF